MPALSPTGMASGHASPWVRFVIRTLSIRGSTWWILVVSLAATAFVCRSAWQSERKSQRMRFEAEAQVLHAAVSERMNRYSQVLQGVCGLFAASEKVEPEEFAAFVSSLDCERNYPGVLSMGYVPRDPSNPESMVVRYLEPPSARQAFVGRDLGRDPAQLRAAAKACDTGMASLSPKTVFAEAPGNPGAILYEAHYQNGSNPDSSGDRRRQLTGWVFMAVRVADVMETVRRTTGSALDYEIHDGELPSGANLLSQSAPSSSISPRDRFEQQTTVNLLGQPWSFRIHAPIDGVSRPSLLPVAMLAGGGVAISFLLFGIAQSMATTGQRACELAMGMTEEIQRQKEALRKSEERLERVIEGSNDGIWDWSVESGDVYLSPRWKSMLGYEDHEIPNAYASWENLLHPEDRDRAFEVLNRYLAGQSPFYQVEHRMRHKDGGYRWILSRGVASRDADGRPLRMAGSHVDLTELKKAEQELLQANRELHQSQSRLKATLDELSASHAQLQKTQLELIQAAKLESVGTLAAGVAHEVKNPLQIILMGLDFLEPRLASAGQDTAITLQDMRDAALRADTITRELLKFSTATEFDPVPTDLGGVLERSLWLMGTDLNRAGVTLVRNFSDELPAVLIDAQRIQQVLINIIGNALQAMNHHGTLTITTFTSRLDQVLPARRQTPCPLKPLDQVVVIKIHDSGPGISDDVLSRIFDPFFTTKAVGSGSGLGLTVVKRIIDLHGACIHIHNSPLGGAEVILAFAIAQKPAPSPRR